MISSPAVCNFGCRPRETYVPEKAVHRMGWSGCSEEDRKEDKSMNAVQMDPLSFMLSGDNIVEAVKSVKSNKGAPGPDGMNVSELDQWVEENMASVKRAIRSKEYRPEPVRRVYIPKPNGKKRPLGIPNVSDRVIQQMAAQTLSIVFEPLFSPFSYGFRPFRRAQDAVEQALEYLNDGYEWIIDFDIEKFFDRVNHDKLISCIRKEINDSAFLHLIRGFLKAGVLENGVKFRSEEGTPQGGPISPVLANIYLNKLDKELTARGLRFVRYADDFLVFVRTETAANRVMDSVSRWIKSKLFLNVSPEKTKVVRPTRSKFLGFTFWKDGTGWKCRPHSDSKKRFKDKIREITCRRTGVNKSLNDLEFQLALTIRGWINYYAIGAMKQFIAEIGHWLRHKVRVIILKKWKNRRTIFNNLVNLYKRLPAYFRKAGLDPKRARSFKFRPDELFAQCYTRCGWYRLANNSIINYILHPVVLETQIPGRYGLIDPLKYYIAQSARWKKKLR